MARYSDELVEETIRLFQPHFTTPLNRDDAEEIIERAAGFIRVISDFLPATLNADEE